MSKLVEALSNATPSEIHDALLERPDIVADNTNLGWKNALQEEIKL